MENTANISSGYIGSVNISIPINGKTIKINRKNKGNIIRTRLKNIAQMKNAHTVKESLNL